MKKSLSAMIAMMMVLSGLSAAPAEEPETNPAENNEPAVMTLLPARMPRPLRPSSPRRPPCLQRRRPL